MRNKLVLVVMILFIAATGTALFAQDWQNYSPSFQEGDIAVQGGIGLLPTWGYTGDVTLLPLSVSVDWAKPISDFPLSFGAFLAFMGANNDSIGVKASYGYIIAGARAAYHVDLEVDNLDTYAGLALGINYAYWSIDWDPPYDYLDSSDGEVELSLSSFVGARYFFTENLGVYGELGYGITVLNLGVTFKF